MPPFANRTPLFASNWTLTGPMVSALIPWLNMIWFSAIRDKVDGIVLKTSTRSVTVMVPPSGALKGEVYFAIAA